MRKYWKYRYMLLLLFLLLLPFNRKLFLFLHIPVKFYEGIIMFMIFVIAILVFTYLEEFTRTFFVPDEKKKNPSPESPVTEKDS